MNQRISNPHNAGHRRRLTRLAIGGGLAAALTIGVATTAFAGTNPNANPAANSAKGDGKAACLEAISKRLTTLDELTAAAAKDQNPTNAGALKNELATEKSGLTGLQGQVQGAGDVTSLKELCTKVVLDYRVYALEVPTTHLAVAADSEIAIATTLDDKVPALQKLIDDATAKGTDTTAAKAKLTDLQARTAAAHQAVTGTGATVIALTPAQFNGGEATPVLQSSRTSVEQTRDGLKAAVQDAKDIVTALRPAGH